MKAQTIQIKFEGQTHQIDANTLINTLIHYNTIIMEANREFSGGSKNVTISINAIEKGSFVIDIVLKENMITSLFSTENVVYVSALTTVVSGIFTTYKYFRGKPIKKNESNPVIMGNDNIVNSTIVNVYNQPMIREAISKSIVTANEDINVDGISISSDHAETVTFGKSEFADLIYTEFDMETDMPSEKEEIVEAILTITKLSFEKGGQWQFLYAGFKITMVVKDDLLMNHIDAGAKFAKGDSIKVKMKITKRYNSEYKAYENKSYRIIEFIEHISSPKQGMLF